jgi:hypothetical protein
MDGRNFDELTRRLATGASRRAVLRGLIGGGAAFVGMKAAKTAAADKTTICHFPPGNPANVQINSVGNPSLPAHFAHGDTIYGDCCVDDDCAPTIGECGVLDGCLPDDDNVSSCVYSPDNSLCSSACADQGYDQCCTSFCSESYVCEVQGTPGETCDDGVFCTDPDTCGEEPGVCGGPERDCGEDASWDCVTYFCNEVEEECGSTIHEGASCDDGTGTCDAAGECMPNPDPPICAERVLCENVRGSQCATDVCPSDSQNGNNRGVAGVCCTNEQGEDGNGLCCSNSCVNGVCQ